MTPNVIIRLTACVCITAIETVAILKGIDGAAFGFAIAAIGAIAGSTLKPVTDLLKPKNKDNP